MEIDLLDPKLYQGDPHPAFAWLRENDPVRWDERHRLWLVTRYEDVVYVSKNPQLFCSGRGVRPNDDTKISMITEDEPRHTRLRKLVNRGFTPRQVSRLEPHIRELVDRILSRIAPRGECDFVRDVAVELPLMVIAELMGIDTKDRDRFWEWSDAMIAADGQPEGSELGMRAQRAFQEYAAYLVDVFEDRRRRPREDLVSVLVSATDEGLLETDEEELSNDELLMFMTLLLVAGNETTRNAISGGVVALSEHPEQRAKLLADRSLVPTAVEEVLRWTSPIINFRRTATQDTELAGRPIHAGEQVLIFYPSANRDPAAFEDADRFRVDRDPNPHVAFGIGNHFCLGANLARLEMRVMFEELLARLPDLRIAPGAGPVYAASSFVRGIESLPVIYTPA